MVMGYDSVSNSIISTYRGSDNALNWIEDFDFIKVDYVREGCTDCRVHQGFNADYNSLAGESVPYQQLLKEKYPNAEIVIVGHSLGGAIAVISAVEQALIFGRVSLYTYGQPRVGNSEFAAFQNLKITGDNLRAIYRNDPVPTLPY